MPETAVTEPKTYADVKGARWRSSSGARSLGIYVRSRDPELDAMEDIEWGPEAGATKRPEYVLGGSARALASVARLSDEQRGATLRASLRLRLRLNLTLNIEAERADLLRTMNEGFKGTKFSRTAEAREAVEGEAKADRAELQDGIKALTDLKREDLNNFEQGLKKAKGDIKHLDVGDTVAEVQEGAHDAGEAMREALEAPTAEALQAAFGDLASATGAAVEAVKEAVSSVTDNVPLIGTLVSGLKVLKCSVQLIVHTISKVKISRLQESSYSVVEGEVFTAVQRLKNVEALNLGAELANAIVSGTTSALGVSAITGPVQTALKIAVKIMVRIMQYIDVMDINTRLADGTLTFADVEDYPAIALYVPYLPAMDPPSIMGILPPGLATRDPAHPAVRELRSILSRNDPFGRELLAALALTSSAKVGALVPEGPWKVDVERYTQVLQLSDEYITNQEYVLYRGTTLFHVALPVSLKQRIDAKIDDTKKKAIAEVKLWFTSAWSAVKGTTTTPTTPSPVTRSTSPVEPFETPGRGDVVVTDLTEP